jgi:hypothetical protein
MWEGQDYFSSREERPGESNRRIEGANDVARTGDDVGHRNQEEIWTDILARARNSEVIHSGMSLP